ncbi:hypothetical protein [Serratia aquatilis]|uniref:Uncharacterized protein n=1 Tax=Serratia aquatilis TaxID=1737515 RepID=A0ABV6EBJ0_9GAMM
MNTASVSISHSQAIPKLRWLRIVPPILIACIISYMAHVKIAFAMPGGMDEELGIISTLSDRTGKCKIFVSLPLACFAICMALSVLLKEHIWWPYTALVSCGVFIQAAAGVFWTIPPKLFNAGGYSLAVSLAIASVLALMLPNKCDQSARSH